MKRRVGPDHLVYWLLGSTLVTYPVPLLAGSTSASILDNFGFKLPNTLVSPKVHYWLFVFSCLTFKPNW